ncbi:MAG TPA: hypothetical protein VKG26_15500, partial [Bacteroidia bacterium]|nr:hypothetical protein [Bacteroidia bacterium]
MKTYTHLYQTTLIIGMQVISLCNVKAQTNNQHKVIYTTKMQAKVRRQKYCTAGFNVGSIGLAQASINNISGNSLFIRTLNYGFGTVEDTKGHHELDLTANTSMGINTGFMWRDKKHDSFTALQAEVQNNKACYQFNYPFCYTWQGNNVVQWVEEDRYLKCNVAIERCWHKGTSDFSGGSKYWYFRESFGETFFHRGVGTTLANKIRIGNGEDFTDNGTGMKTLITSVHQNTFMLGTEFGIRHVTKNHQHSFDIGLVYYAPFTSTYTEQYEFFKNGASVGKSSITYNGGMFIANLRYSLNYLIKNKSDSVAVKIKNEIAADKPTHKINNRHVEVQKTMQVATDLVTVSVWVGGLVDGDQISLY